MSKKQAATKKRGRPSLYSPALADSICARLAEGESLRSICRDEAMPCAATVFVWLDADKEFQTKYARAREIQAELNAADIIEIADDGTNDWMERKNADGECTGWVENGEAIRRSALRVATRQWTAEKLLPKKYGAKLALGGSDDMPPIRTMSDDQLLARIAALQAKLDGKS